jgi:hypothetical protein
MADMTATQLTDFRADIADTNSAFTDAELQRLWTRCDGASTDYQRFEASKGLAIRQLLHDAAKFNDYAAGETEEKKAVIFDHYKKLYDGYYAPIVDALFGNKKQFVWAQMRAHPHQTRTEPTDDNGTTEGSL